MESQIRLFISLLPIARLFQNQTVPLLAPVKNKLLHKQNFRLYDSGLTHLGELVHFTRQDQFT